MDTTRTLYVDAAHAFSLQVNRQLALFVEPAASETVVVRTRKPDPGTEGVADLAARYPELRRGVDPCPGCIKGSGKLFGHKGKHRLQLERLGRSES